MGAAAAIRSRLTRDPGLAFLLAALALAAVLYAPAIPRGLTNFDDPWLYRDNFVVRSASFAHLRTIFLDLDASHRFVVGAEYLPIRDLSVTLDYALFGDWYPGFHATSVALYLAAIALWFHALAALGVDRRVAGLAMLVWALHPAHAESVAWLAERKGVLAAAFAGAAVLGYARYRTGGAARWLALAAICAACAIWSKASAAFAIAALVPLEIVLHAGTWRRALTGLAVVGTAAAAAFAPVVLVASRATVVGSATHAPGGHLALVLGVHGFYARLAAMLVRDAAAYPIASLGPSPVDIVVGATTLALVLAVATLPRRGRFAPSPTVRASAWLWLLGWLPIGHAILPLQNTVADRYALFPTLGLALAVAALVDRLPGGRARTALIVAIVAAASLRTCDAQRAWSTPRTLWERAVASDPDDAAARSHYAEALDEDGDPQAALAVIADGAPSPVLELRRALLLRELGDAAGALAAMRAAATGGEPKAMSDLALLELAGGETADALAWARRGAQADPLRAQAQRTLGKVALAAELPAEALPAFQQAYALEPAAAANRYNLALALMALDRRAEARPFLESCLDDPALGRAASAQLGAP